MTRSTYSDCDGDEHFFYPHVLDPLAEVWTVDAIPVSQQEPRSLLKGNASTIC